MNMTVNNTLYQLERERKRKILSLKPEEAERYIDSLHERMIKAYGNVANDFNEDLEAFTKAADLCDEAVELLKDDYPNISSYVAWSRIDALVTKLRETADDVHDLKLKEAYVKLLELNVLMGTCSIILRNIMHTYYDFYSCRGNYDNIFHLIGMTNLPEEDKRKVVNALDELPVYDTYNKYYMNSMDFILQVLLKIMEPTYERLKKAADFTIDDETEDDDFFNKFRKDMLELQQQSKDLMEEYDAFLDDGFHESKEIERQVLCDMWHQNRLYTEGICDDRDYVDYIQYNRPSYDLRNMTFIPSQYDQDKMADDPAETVKE